MSVTKKRCKARRLPAVVRLWPSDGNDGDEEENDGDDDDDDGEMDEDEQFASSGRQKDLVSGNKFLRGQLHLFTSSV